MEKLASQVFLLTPASVEVSDDERRRIEERGFDR
jgi:FtsZ-interacting cell division protein YlmF